MAPHGQRIPIFYRIFLLYVEPFFSLMGAFYAGERPRAYLQLTDLRSAPLMGIPVGTEVVLRQLANLYLLFALNEAIVLRVTDDVRVWRALLVGLLIADFGHLYSLLPLGLDVYWKVHHWTEMDWGNVAFVYFGAATRVAFLTGVGFSARSSMIGGQRKGN
ncbi:hypothetical protein SMAC_06673 [Paecilomyces variotii No. 5]|uniref:DUF7704 domain-containing protein n=1 Tax=Byssochlamys spectabilis (strain No. 5 / NBRC 109023) TaxID=1356009 RepID=V5I1R2_BYSSN|nr:hypothetical protein SMAC_06673 [Paecilomyces variotii No. 5]